MRHLSLTYLIHEITQRKGARTGSFEFDEAQLLSICERLVNLINERFWNGQSLNGRGNQKLSIKSPIDGKVHKINFRLRQILDHDEFLSGPKASWSFRDQEIVFSIPDEFLWFAHEPEQWVRQFYQNFIHELTHAFDTKGNSDYVRGNYFVVPEKEEMEKLSPEEKQEMYRKYYTDPAEVKAYLTQINKEMEQNLRNNPTIQRPEELLDSSHTWNSAKQYWQTKPKKVIRLFLRAAFDVLQARK